MASARWSAVSAAGLGAACLIGAALEACGDREPDPAGLVVTIETDGVVQVAQLSVQAQQGTGPDAGDRIDLPTCKVPSECRLPTTFAIVSNGDPTAAVSFTITARDAAGQVIDRRDHVIQKVPTDRVASFVVVLSAKCASKIGPDGEALCPAGTTCDAATGGCVASAVGGAELPDTGVDAPGFDAGPPLDVALACPAGRKTCDGRCVDAADPANGCAGASCSPCSGDPNATYQCSSGSCTIADCSAGNKACGGACVPQDPAHGCASSSQCAPCASDPHASAYACEAGACAVAACASGFKSCGGACVAEDPAHGCASAASCAACAGDPHASSYACEAGACASATCEAGYKRCGAACVRVDDPSFGCGASTCDASSCPTPGMGTLTCAGGACVIGACNAGYKVCGSVCAPTDAAHGCAAGSCAECGGDPQGIYACAASGACELTSCKAGYKQCGGACVPTDVAHGCQSATDCSACAGTCQGSPTTSCCVDEPMTATCSTTFAKCGPTVNNCGHTVTCPSPPPTAYPSFPGCPTPLDRGWACWQPAPDRRLGGADYKVLTLCSDDVVLDARTGLMWARDTEPGSYAPATAVAQCSGSRRAGFSDWRAPSLTELLSLRDYTRARAPLIDDASFAGVVGGMHVAVTTDEHGAISSWFNVRFDDGYVETGPIPTVTLWSLRCVR